jgi:hypothetical protein
LFFGLGKSIQKNKSPKGKISLKFEYIHIGKRFWDIAFFKILLMKSGSSILLTQTLNACQGLRPLTTFFNVVNGRRP